MVMVMVTVMVVVMMMMKLWQVLRFWHMLTLSKLSVSILFFFVVLWFIVQKQTPCAFQDEIQQHNFYHFLHKFLCDQLHNESDSGSDISGHCLPEFHGKLSVYLSTVATFFIQSNICGVNRMHWECIHAVPSWRWSLPQYDCLFIHTNSQAEGMQALDVAWV